MSPASTLGEPSLAGARGGDHHLTSLDAIIANIFRANNKIIAAVGAGSRRLSQIAGCPTIETKLRQRVLFQIIEGKLDMLLF
jgi:hypothetical protein